MTRRALSAREVDALMNKPGLHRVDENLFLQVREDGTRSWVFRFAQFGKRRVLGLGRASRVSYTKARASAAEYRSMLWNGVDVAAEHASRRPRPQPAAPTEPSAAPTFEWCAKELIAAREKSHKSHFAQRQWPSSMRDHVNPHIGHLAVDKVGLNEVHKVLAPIWQTMYPTASKVRQRVAAILDWAAAKGYRPDENPARPNGPLDQLLPPVRHREEHHAAVPYTEMPALMKRLTALDSVSAKALVFTILTAVRTGETLGAEWAEVDAAARLWTIPVERTKTSQEHRVPLATQAIALLDTLPRKGKLVFPNRTGKKPLSNMAMMMVLRGLRKDSPTVHGMRATFSTWAREKTDFSEEVIEWALAHGTVKVTAAYARTSRLEERRLLMQAWADYLTGSESVS